MKCLKVLLTSHLSPVFVVFKNERILMSVDISLSHNLYDYNKRVDVTLKFKVFLKICILIAIQLEISLKSDLG